MSGDALSVINCRASWPNITCSGVARADIVTTCDFHPPWPTTPFILESVSITKVQLQSISLSTFSTMQRITTLFLLLCQTCSTMSSSQGCRQDCASSGNEKIGHSPVSVFAGFQTNCRQIWGSMINQYTQCRKIRENTYLMRYLLAGTNSIQDLNLADLLGRRWNDSARLKGNISSGPSSKGTSVLTQISCV